MTRANPALVALLGARAKEPATVSLQDLKKEIDTRSVTRSRVSSMNYASFGAMRP